MGPYKLGQQDGHDGKDRRTFEHPLDQKAYDDGYQKGYLEYLESLYSPWAAGYHKWKEGMGGLGSN
jgi:hypothetical protein